PTLFRSVPAPAQVLARTDMQRTATHQWHAPGDRCEARTRRGDRHGVEVAEADRTRPAGRVSEARNVGATHSPGGEHQFVAQGSEVGEALFAPDSPVADVESSPRVAIAESQLPTVRRLELAVRYRPVGHAEAPEADHRAGADHSQFRGDVHLELAGQPVRDPVS